MTRLKTDTLTRPSARKRAACVNGHPWREETTRWRKRTRNGRASTERDCLVCKRESDHERRSRRRQEQRQETTR